MDLTVVPLHKNKQYLLDCCKLINDEWKRSETARLHSLNSSSDTLPTCLILLKNNKVIGHLKLSIIPSIKDACFLESVVIDKALRGQGYGTILMNKCEDYCKDNLHNLKTIYLKTKGQEKFYNNLGYTECERISIYGSYTPKTSTTYTNNNNNKQNNTVLGGTPPTPPPLPAIEVKCSKHTFMRKDLF